VRYVWIVIIAVSAVPLLYVAWLANPLAIVLFGMEWVLRAGGGTTQSPRRTAGRRWSEVRLLRAPPARLKLA